MTGRMRHAEQMPKEVHPKEQNLKKGSRTKREKSPEESMAKPGRVNKEPSKRRTPRKAKEYPPDDTFRAVMRLIRQGRNLFITGGAGVGKSYLLHQIKKELGETLHVTSTTGISALNVGGQTLHSWSYIGIANRSVESVVSGIMANPIRKRRLTECEIVAIDEISMLDDFTLDYINAVLKKVRNNKMPFGGIQVLIFGDFFQLPPVKMKQNGREYCFRSATWQELELYPIVLTEVKRQTDAAMAEALNHFRTGDIREEDVQLLQSREAPPSEKLPDDILQIFGANRDADALNQRKLYDLETESVFFHAEDEFYRYQRDGRRETIRITRDGTDGLSTEERKIWEDFDRDCKAPSVLELRLGCRVMLLINIDVRGGLVNGTCGTVTKLSASHIEVLFDGQATSWSLEREKFDCMRGEQVLTEREQYPLRLAYGITIHKSQGMTFDRLVVHMNKIFDFGQAYVALSRTRTLEGLFIRSFSRRLIAADPCVIRFYEELKNEQLTRDFELAHPEQAPKANVYGNKEHNMSLQIHRNEGGKEGYFKLYNHRDIQQANKVARIHFKSPTYEKHINWEDKKEWTLNVRERVRLMGMLRSKPDGEYTVWQMLILAYNREGNLNDADTLQNFSHDPVHPNHLPIDLPIPDYSQLS